MSDKNAINDLIQMKFATWWVSKLLIKNLNSKYSKFKMAD